MIERLLTEQRWMLPWLLTVAALDLAGVAAFVLGAAADTPAATYVGLGLIWAGAIVVIIMCLRIHQKGQR